MVSPTTAGRARGNPGGALQHSVTTSRGLGGRPEVQPLRITVLMGGPGPEREVSQASGEAVATALESLGHDVCRADVGPENLGALGHEADLVFVALHGEFGEDGALQQVMDQRGIRYAGSGAAASQRAMDKLLTKELLIAEGIATPPYAYVQRQGLRAEQGCYRLPAVVKPVDGGSSVDTTVVHHSLQLLGAVHRLLSRHGRCLVEDYIAGPELTVGILGEQVLGPMEIRPRRGFYDYQAKYIADDTEYIFDIDLPVEVLEEVRRDSLRAHRLLGCLDFSRVDWVVDRRGGRAFCLEVNTIPGFTSHSLLPKMAARAGVGFPALCQRIVDLAMRR